MEQNALRTTVENIIFIDEITLKHWVIDVLKILLSTRLIAIISAIFPMRVHTLF